MAFLMRLGSTSTVVAGARKVNRYLKLQLHSYQYLRTSSMKSALKPRSHRSNVVVSHIERVDVLQLPRCLRFNGHTDDEIDI